MGKYLKKFELTAQYKEYINSAIASLPNISLIKDDNTVQYNHNYLKFTAEENNSTIKLNAATSPDIKYSLNGGNWTQWDYRTITLNTGDNVRMKGNNSNGFNTSPSYNNYNKFQMTGKISASGNIMSLLYGDDFEGKLTIPCEYCFYGMFMDCTSLTTAPELPATTLTNNCYEFMFQDCFSLTAAPKLPATTLADSCYYGMFCNCWTLTTAPVLPAVTLADFCYQQMFSGCTSLTMAPELSAKTLAYACYREMFFDCATLSTAPKLPAETLADFCYQQMFFGCTALTTAPELPSKILVHGCYQQMFYDCTKLNYIKMLATDISASDCLSNWVSGVARTGIFIKDPNMTSLLTGTSGIPYNWIVNPVPNYLTFTAEEDNSTILLNSATSPDIKYSLNRGEWIQWDYNAITLNAGDTVRMKGNNNNGFSFEDGSFNYFEMTGTIGASGNIMSLLYGDDLEIKLTMPCEWCFSHLFSNCKSLTTAPELPPTTLTGYCYSYMFQGCTALTVGPELPATILDEYCCFGMFQGCSSLTTAPKLPATTLADSCYGGMFEGCTALTTAPVLNATKLTPYCYRRMFAGCTALTTAPVLYAETLTSYCYDSMFSGCTSLNSITCLATDISATDCTNSWVDGVSSIGTFTKPASMTGWTNGVNGIPNGWTVEDRQESQHLIIYVDEFPFEKLQNKGETVEEAMHRQIYASDECAIGNKYEYTGQKITYNDNQYYLWEMTEPCEFSPQVKYLMTTTTNFNTLFGESLEDDLQNKFVSFVGMLNADKEVTYINTDTQVTDNELYLVKVVMGVQRLRMWVDDFPLEVQQTYNEAHQNLLQMTLADPDSNSNRYVYTNNTIEMNGSTYYVWEYVLNDTTDDTTGYSYLLTSTDDIDTLYSQSLEDDFNNEFVSFAGRCSSDLNDIYVENRITGKMCLVKVTLENETPVIYVDDFAASLKEYEVSNPSGANPYIYNGNTITYDGNTYYLWKAEEQYENNNENTRYFATSTIDFDELYAQSLEDDINNTFTSAIGMFSDNEEIYNAQAVREDGTDEHYLVKIEKI